MSGPTKIVVDTREQDPWPLPGLGVVRKALKFGDYAISGRERICVVERKAGSDLVGSLTVGYERLCKEMARAREAGSKMFMVCDSDFATCQALMDQHYNGRSLARRVALFANETGVVPVFAGSRLKAAAIGLALLENSKTSSSC